MINKPLKLSLKIFFIKQNGHLLDVRFNFYTGINFAVGKYRGDKKNTEDFQKNS